MAKPKAMQILLEQYDLVSMLSDEEAGKLFKALFQFAENGEITEFNGMLKMAFVAISKQVKNFSDHYEEKCRKNSENAKRKNTECKRPLATVYECDQMHPNINRSINTNENIDIIQNENINVIEGVSGSAFGKGNGDEGVGGTGGAGEEEEGKPIPQSSPPSDLQRYAQKLRKEKS